MSAPEAAVANRENATSPLFAGHYPSSKVVTPNTRSSRNGGIAPVYMRAVSNTGTSPRSCANATASRLMLGTSRKIFPPADAGQQSRWDHLGGGAVVGHQRPDLAALAAWTDHAPADKPAIAHKGATDMPGRAIQARRNAGRGAGNTVASYASTAANGTSASAKTPACGASGAATMPP